MNTDYFGNIIPDGAIVVPSGFMNDNLQCDWGNKSGRCGEEISYNVTFDRPPCGHEVVFSQDFDSSANMRFCARHMIRFMFTSLTTRRCGTCGSEYKGLAILRSLERL